MSRAWLLAFVLFACSDGPTPAAPPPCDEKCKDGIALRGMRETLKLAFNLTLQGKPVGTYDVTQACIKGGSVRVVGSATSNAVQGATEVDVTYTFDKCGYVQKQTEANQNYSIELSGSIEEKGTLAVQPSATTALLLKSASVSITGTVYDPPNPYEAKDCSLDAFQSGNHVAGTMCGREVTFDF